MKRNIVKIDQDKCNGCGLCVSACHERAIELNAQGKAELIKEDYCDGLGDCLPACPTGAISIEERETVPYDEAAVMERIAKMDAVAGGGCPGAMARILAGASVSASKEEECGCDAGDKKHEECGCDSSAKGHGECGCDSDKQGDCCCDGDNAEDVQFSHLSHWPVQIRLAASKADFFDNADLLVAADCAAYAYGNFHKKFMKDRVTVVGCPKLDPYDYEEKFYEIFMNNNIRSVTLVRMEVPCCGGMERAVLNALDRCGKFIPKQVVVLSLQGDIIRK